VFTRRVLLANSSALLAAAAVRPAFLTRAFADKSLSATSVPPGVPLLGVDDDPDQTPESLWDEDARRIADFGFTNARLADDDLMPAVCGGKEWIFLRNHSATSQEIRLPGTFQDSLTGTSYSGKARLAPYDVLALQTA
jgi:beta-galactosidase GanA